MKVTAVPATTVVRGVEAATVPSAAARLIDPASLAWQDFVGNHADATIFHQPAWARILAESFNYEPRIQIVEDREGEIVAAWPAMLVRSRLTGNRMVCMPFCHRAGPLINNHEQGMQLLTAVAADAAEYGARSIEVRDWPRTVTPPSRMDRVSLFTTHEIDLAGGTDAVWLNLSHGPRNSIRRAHRAGLTTRISVDRGDLHRFYQSYVRQRKQQALLPQPWTFVSRIHEKFILPGGGFLVVVERDGQPVCFLLALEFGPTVTSTHSAAEPAARSTSAMALAMWALITEACARGRSRYDLGRTPVSAPGLHNFKNQWGGTGRELVYYYSGRVSGVNVTPPSAVRRLLLQSCSRIAPAAVFRRLGDLAYPHLG